MLEGSEHRHTMPMQPSATLEGLLVVVLNQVLGHDEGDGIAPLSCEGVPHLLAHRFVVTRDIHLVARNS